MLLSACWFASTRVKLSADAVAAGEVVGVDIVRAHRAGRVDSRRTLVDARTGSGRSDCFP